MLGRVAKHFPLKMSAKSFSREHDSESRQTMGTKSPFCRQRASHKVLFRGIGCLSSCPEPLPPAGGSPQPASITSRRTLWSNNTHLGSWNYMLWTIENKTPGPHRASERRAGISGLGVTDGGALAGSVVPAPESDQGSWLPCFPQELASSVTPSLTKKSSLPKIPHAAGKRKKGQNDVGVCVINHLVHKNCLITGKIWKSTYYSEQRAPRGVCEGEHASELCRPTRPQLAPVA